MNFLQNHCRMLKLQDKLGAASLGVALLGKGDEVGVHSLQQASVSHLGLGVPLDPATQGACHSSLMDMVFALPGARGILGTSLLPAQGAWELAQEPCVSSCELP